MNYLLYLLFAFFRLGVTPITDPPDDDSTQEADPDAEPDEEGATETDEDEEDDDEITGALEQAEPPSKKRKEDAYAAEERRINEAAQRAARETAQALRPPPAPQVDPTWAREEQELEAARAGGDQQVIANKVWEVNTNRTLRQSQRDSAMALLRAEDLNDRAEFRELRNKDAKMFDKYAPIVEQELAKFRANGRNIGRTELYKWVVGGAVIDAKAKSGTKRRAAPLPENVTRIDRGRSPTVRGDVSARGDSRMNEHQKREKRLLDRKI